MKLRDSYVNRTILKFPPYIPNSIFFKIKKKKKESNRTDGDVA